MYRCPLPAPVAIGANRHPATGRLEANQTTEAGGNSDRSPAVTGCDNWHHTSLECRRRPTTGPARVAGEIPGIADCSGKLGIANILKAKFRHIGPAHHDKAQSLDAFYEIRSLVGYIVGHKLGARIGRLPSLELAQVLEQNRYPKEGRQFLTF